MPVPKKKVGSDKREDRSSRRPAPRKRSADAGDDDDLFDVDKNEFDRSGVAAQLITRYGSANAALEQLMGERFRESQKRRRLQEQLKETEDELDEVYDRLGLDPSAEVPDKSTVISVADKTELEEFRKLGKLEDVKKKAEEHGALVQKQTEADNLALRTESAKLAGNWDVDVLATMVKDRDLILEIREVEKEGGTKEKVPFIRENKDKAEATRLAEFVTKDEKAKKLLPALTANSNGGDRRQGTLYPRTTGTGGTVKADPMASVGARDIRPSQFRPGAQGEKKQS